MKKGKRFVMEGLGAWNCEATEDPDGAWIFDPDEEMISRDVAIAANARADCYEEQMKDLARGIDERNIKLLADLIVAQEKVGFLENQVTDLSNFLQEKKKRIRVLERQKEGRD